MAANNLGLTAKGFIMIKELIRLANELDSKGLVKEADALDSIIKEAQDTGGEYENKIEAFTITDKKDGGRVSVVAQLIQQRGNHKAAEKEVRNNSDTKVYNSNNKTIKYQSVHATTPDHKALEETPYTMELMIKQVENGRTMGKKVYRHTGLTMSPEIKEKYEEARSGLLTLDEKEQKLDSLV